jgi:hypothetical protein
LPNPEQLEGPSSLIGRTTRTSLGIGLFLKASADSLFSRWESTKCRSFFQWKKKGVPTRAEPDKEQKRDSWDKSSSKLEAPCEGTDLVEDQIGTETATLSPGCQLSLLECLSQRPKGPAYIKIPKATQSWKLMTRPPRIEAGTVSEDMIGIVVIFTPIPFPTQTLFTEIRLRHWPEQKALADSK